MDLILLHTEIAEKVQRRISFLTRHEIDNCFIWLLLKFLSDLPN